MEQGKRMMSFGEFDRRDGISWLLILVAVSAYLIYKLHDFTEPFAYGHARWAEAYFYYWGMMHLDLGLAETLGANVEGITDDGSLLFYRSVGPLQGLIQAFLLYLFNSEPWAVRILPLIGNTLNIGLLLWLAVRWLGARSPVFLVLIYLGTPFLLKYGTSNEGLFAFTLTMGLAGWIFYQKFLDDGKNLNIYAAMLFFAVGTGFSWHAGAMGLPIYLHMLFCNRPTVWKIKHIAVFSALMLASILLILIHQGIVTGDYLYPLRRVIERSSNVDLHGAEFSWLELARVQLRRIWEYFGPATIILASYWLIRRLPLQHQRRDGDLWILALLLTGAFYGVLFRQAALIHDYLLLGFLPGFVLAATAGAIDLIGDGKRLFAARGRLLKSTGVLVVAFILLGHGLLAVRSASVFEQKEAKDLDGGEAAIASFLLNNLQEDAILAADASSSFHVVESEDGKRFCVIRPHLAYLTRRPVRYVGSSSELKDLLQEARQSRRDVALVHLEYGPESKNLQIPVDWVDGSRKFKDKATVYLWDHK